MIQTKKRQMCDILCSSKTRSVFIKDTAHFFVAIEVIILSFFCFDRIWLCRWGTNYEEEQSCCYYFWLAPHKNHLPQNLQQRRLNRPAHKNPFKILIKVKSIRHFPKTTPYGTGMPKILSQTMAGLESIRGWMYECVLQDIFQQQDATKLESMP